LASSLPARGWLVNRRWPTIVDVRRSSEQTKAVILAAARERFGAVGFHGATIRAIAAEAGIDPAMIMRYFGSKDELFAAVAEFDLRLPDLAAVDREHVGRALVAHFLDRWEGDEALKALLRASTTNEEAVARMHHIFSGQLEPAVAQLGADAVSARAGLIATQILGLALCRYVLRLPSVVDMSREEVIFLISPTIQRYFDVPIAMDHRQRETVVRTGAEHSD
jgi:AcrR family transcriptional regulator